MEERRCCENCKLCLTDSSVGHYECLCEDITEDEIVEYFEDAKNGCPHWVEDDRDLAWIYALEKLASSGKQMPTFTT